MTQAKFWNFAKIVSIFNESFVFLDQHYAMAGLKTCLVIHSQDPTADCLLNCKIGTSPIACHNNLSAVRLETTKVCFSLPIHFPVSNTDISSLGIFYSTLITSIPITADAA